MEQPQANHENHVLFVDIPDVRDVSTSGSSSENPSNGLNLPHDENTTVQNDQASGVRSSSSSSYGSNTQPGPSSYKVLVSIKITFKISLIISSIIVLVLSRHEKPHNPLFAWIVGYTVGCAVSSPMIFRHCFVSCPWLCRQVDRFRWLLEFFFALWFVLGNYWIFGEKSYSEAPIMYRFAIVLLVLDYIKYIGPTLLCAIVFCCYRGLLQKNGAAPAESINALPIYNFQLQENGSGNVGEAIEKKHEGGVVAAGTERERALSGEDAVCCICLASYDDNDVLKELPCSHLFHATCVDEWLKIKAFCPLCKCMIHKSPRESPPAADSNQQV